MRVRQPTIDYSEVKARWTEQIEFAHTANAASMVPAYIEPYLIKVMRRVKVVLDPSERELHDDVDIFIKQEAQHYKQHQAFNNAIRAQGYEGMAAIEKAYDDDYERWLATKSLRFHVAYSEGFEAIGSSGAAHWVDDVPGLVPDADPAVLEMWRWHLAEEFEHRTVCFRIYHALYGKGPFRGYFYRVYGFLYAVAHIGKHTTRMTRYLLETDRATMTPEELTRSKAREKAQLRSTVKRSLRMVVRVMSPFYDPAKLPTPRGLATVLDAY